MTQLLREHLEGHAGTTVLNRGNFGTVTLFRAYPDGVDTFSIKQAEFEDAAHRESLLAHNTYNREIFELRACGSDGGARRDHLHNRLLPTHHLRRTDCCAEVIHPLSICR